MGFKIEAHRNKDVAPSPSGEENAIQTAVMDVSCDVGWCQKPYNCLERKHNYFHSEFTS